MNNNPEGTPNPLNPNPAPVGPAATPGVTPVAPQPTAQPAPQPVMPSATAPQPVAPAPAAPEPVASQPVVPAPTASNSIEAALAEEQTVPTQPAEEPAKKKNGGLIGIIIVFVVALIGCAAAAIVMLNPFGSGTPAEDDRVPKALAALFAEGAPTNVGMDGNVTLYTYDEESPVVSLEIDFSSKTNVASNAGTAEATITANFSNDTYLKFDADEIHTEKGDLYLKLSGIPEAITSYKKQVTEVDCASDDVTDCATNAAMIDQYVTTLQSLGVIDVIDNEWILIPSSNFSNVEDLTQLNTSTQCLIDAVGTIGEYTDDLTAAYNANQFITYSTQDLKITKKQDNLYRLGINSDAFANFINAMATSGFVNELNACMGTVATNSSVDANDLNDIVEALPTIYVEVNEDLQFTRVYLKASTEDGSMDAVADISLSYPTEFTLTEPSQYIDINTVLSKVLSFVYGGVIPQDADENSAVPQE